MRVLWLTRSAVLPLLVVGVACARNNESNDTGAATRDTAGVTMSDSARANQTESGVTDSSGQSTLGPGVEQTRPDQGQPVTSKGDTVSTGADTTSAGMEAATWDTTGAATADSAKGNQTESGVTDSSGQSTLGPAVEQTRPDQGQPVTSKGDTVNMGVDSATTGR